MYVILLTPRTRREFYGNFYHTEYGNNSHTIDFHTVL